jgi:hypothetical protein
MHVDNTPLPDEPGDVRFPTPVPKGEGPGRSRRDSPGIVHPLGQLEAAGNWLPADR